MSDNNQDQKCAPQNNQSWDCWRFYLAVLADFQKQHGDRPIQSTFVAEDIGQVFTYVKHYMDRNERRSHCVQLFDGRHCLIVCSVIDPRIYVVWPESLEELTTIRIQGFEGKGHQGKNMSLFVSLPFLLQIGKNAC